MSSSSSSSSPKSMVMDLATEVTPLTLASQLQHVHHRFQGQEYSFDLGVQGGQMVTLSTPHTPVLQSSLTSEDLIQYWTLQYKALLEGPKETSSSTGVDLLELKKKKELAPNQIFSLVNDTLFQAKRSGESQSLIIFGDDARSKYDLAVDHFIRLCQLGRKSNRFGMKYKAAKDVLRAFTCPMLTTTPSYVDLFELQLLSSSPSKRASGFKFHIYHFDPSQLLFATPNSSTSTSTSSSSFSSKGFSLPLIFHVLLKGLHPELQSSLHISEAMMAPFASSISSSPLTPTETEMINELLLAFEFLDLHDRHLQSVYRFLSGLCILSSIQFQDVQGTQARLQEACVISNTWILDMTAELFGVTSTSLESVLTTQVHHLEKDRIFEYLNASQATEKLTTVMTSLYHVLVLWLVHWINSKTSSPKLQNVSVYVTTSPSIPSSSSSSSSSSSCISNLKEAFYTGVSESLLHFLQCTLFEGRRNLMLEQGIHLNLPQYESHEELVALFMDETNGLFNLIGKYKTSSKLVDQFVEKNPSKALMKISDEKFEVLLVAGKHKMFDTTSWIQENKEIVNEMLIHLFRGGFGEMGSEVSFIRRFFSDDVLLYLKPLKKELHRASSALSSSIITSGSQASLTVHSVAFYHFKRLFALLKQSSPRFLFALSHHPDPSSVELSLDHVRSQFEWFQLHELCQALVQPMYDLYISFTETSFLEKYECLLRDNEASKDVFTLVTSWIGNEPNFIRGPTLIYLSMRGWQYLEGKYLQFQRKLKRQDRGNKNHRGSMVSDVTYAESIFSDTVSSIGSEDEETIAPEKALSESDSELIKAPSKPELKPHIEEVAMTGQRKRWLAFTWLMTWWVPTFCIRKSLKQDREDVVLAWREKLAICCAIFWVCALQMFVIIALGRIICPKQNILNTEELFYKSSFQSPLVGIYGGVYNLQDFVQMGSFHPPDLLSVYGGLEITSGFPRTPAYYCNYAKTNAPDFPHLFNPAITIANGTVVQLRHVGFYSANMYNAQLSIDSQLKNRVKAMVGWDLNDIAAICRGELPSPAKMVVINERVYDFKPYLNTLNAFSQLVDFFPAGILAYLKANSGKDLSNDQTWMKLWNKDPALRTCFDNLFAVGIVDYRKTARCQVTNYVLLGFSVILVLVIFVKFLAALQLGSRQEPEALDKFVILQVPCYTEDEFSLKKTINSLAALNYDDRRKLLFIICDGNIIGSGNDRPTPRIVLDILGWGEDDFSVEPVAKSFQSLGEGMRQHNMAKVYSGLYQFEGHVVPYIVVVKVGRPTENFRPGNRGKRDSQMILMRFLNKVYTDKPMSPMELELYHQMKNIIGVNPIYYEFCLMVDADTEVSKDSLNKLVSCMINDTQIMGCCGETRLANEKSSIITMIQVYEYYISHFMAKAFESLFGSVTCLPGCFCMYRLRSTTKNQPVLPATPLIEEYGECNVDTLHKKNLLHLGEDRYLTTLMLKNFPKMKTVFTGNSYCETIAPESWKVLLSQRRRWINSTVHNLVELLNVSELCGFCCFSMRFVVFIDLLATLVQPAIMIYIGYLVYLIVDSINTGDSSQFPLISLILLAAMYGFQAIVFLIKGEFQHIGWMIIYLLSIPVFSFFIPVYSFWHMDDFSWGNTRVVVGEKGKKQIISGDSEKFDLSTIPHRKWEEYEKELKAAEKSVSVKVSKRLSTASNMSPQSTSSKLLDDFETALNTLNRDSPSTESFAAKRNSLNLEAKRGRTSLISQSHRLSQISTSSQKVSTILPSDEELRDEIAKILASADLMNITKKQIREELSERFGVDLEPQKNFINRTIQEILLQYE